MALAAGLDKLDYRVFVLLGCGEMNEGQVWEAAQAANKYQLGNLVAILDYNRLQLDGTNDQVMPVEPIEQKWQSFGWHIDRIDGHDIPAIAETLAATRKRTNYPRIIIADTVKGKGVSFMENEVDWHGTVPSDEQMRKALDELETV